MAANYIQSDPNTTVPRLIARGLQQVGEGVDTLLSARAIMIQQRDGDGSTAAHYAQVATRGGYQAGDYADANTAAKASFEELDSLLSKLATDDSVDHVDAATRQCAAKHGVAR